MHDTINSPTIFIGQKLRPFDKGRECIGTVRAVVHCEKLNDTALEVEWPGGKIENIPYEPDIQEHGYTWIT